MKRLADGDITAAWEDIVVRLTDFGEKPSPAATPRQLAMSIDTVMVLATISALGEEIPTTTVSQTSNFVRPLPNTDALVDVSVVRAGRTMAFGTASVYPADQPERTAATASIIYAVLRPSP